MALKVFTATTYTGILANGSPRKFSPSVELLEVAEEHSINIPSAFTGDEMQAIFEEAFPDIKFQSIIKEWEHKADTLELYAYSEEEQPAWAWCWTPLRPKTYSLKLG